MRIGQYAQQVVPKRAFASPVLQVQLFHGLLVFAAQAAQGFVLIAAQVQLADVAVWMKILMVRAEAGRDRQLKGALTARIPRIRRSDGVSTV